MEQAKQLTVKIKFVIPTLPKVEKRAAEFMLNNIGRMGSITLAELAAETGSSQASILRLCRRLGMGGFTELKSVLRFYSDDGDDETALPGNPQGVCAGDSMKDILQKVFDCNIRILNDTLKLATEEYEKALQALEKAGHICFLAIGDAVVPCMLAQNKFLKLGIPCSVNTDPDMQIINASILKPDDVAIAISYTGRSKSVVNAMRLAKQAGATTIGITKMEKSPMIRYCDIKLFTATMDLSEGKDVIAQRIAEQAIMEALYLGLVNTDAGKYRQIQKDISESLKGNKIN